ncbi:MAG TPA: flagellar basal body P-ring protein FlgI [Phycisphaerales bacterium]|nr:flagellar basal body P-ring protein FlgI [Phycisphaerales bacterium]
MRHADHRRAWWLGVVCVGLAAASGCGGGKAKPRAEGRRVDPVVRDIPAPLRGTIGAESTIRGIDPVLVSGLGVVVGLNGTGGGELHPAVQATMERELARNGVGRGAPGPMGDAGITPRQMLRDPNVAVVIVEAAIPPGAPEDHRFDVRVRTLPGSSVTSLEGGTLWTTELRIGPASAFGAYKTRVLAEARGPIFINPFAEPGAEGEDAVTRTVGRVLAGGRVTDPLRLELVLDNTSHARARSVVSAINTRFPEGPGDEGPTAHGRNAESIAVRVPRAYAARPAEFVQLLRCTRIDQAYPQEVAKRYVEALKQRPELAEDLSWCLQAVGKPALPFLAELYAYPEALPRMAALRAGARLGDHRVVEDLKEMALAGPGVFREEAVRLLGDLPHNPRVEMALREIVEAPGLDMKVAAYEALSKRGDALIGQVAVGDERRPSFLIETVPTRDRLVYVTQQGQPRIVLFGGGEGMDELSLAARGGEGLRVTKPTLVAAWSDRLMLAADSPNDPVRLYYRDYRTGGVTQQQVPDDLVKLIEFLGRTSTPENPAPGLGLTYSEVVGAVYEIHRQGAIDAPFATETDRLRAALFQAAQDTVVSDRPEGSTADPDDPSSVLVFRPEAPRAEERAKPDGTASMVVPLNTGAGPGGRSGAARTGGTGAAAPAR